MGSETRPANPRERVTILPLRNAVLFPMSVVPINVGRPRSVRVVEDLLNQERALLGVVTQRSPDTVEPTFDDLHQVGTLARVVKVIRLGPGNYSVVLNGLGRFRLVRPVGLEPYMRADVERVRESKVPDERAAALGQTLREKTRQMLSLLPDLPKETAGILDNVREPGALADLIASNFPDEHASIEDRQKVLEAMDPLERVRLVLEVVERQLRVLMTKDQIAAQIRDEMTRSQHEYVLRQQMRTILDELGESADEDEIDTLRDRISRAELPAEAEQAARRQLSRLRSMQPQSAEYNVARTYVEWIADLPWSRTTPDHVDVREVRRCLDEDHHGLERVKRRIVEFSAIRQLRNDKRGPILLFVGPPGVGKTSLGRSIARAMGRRYGRISLGGVRDEAEIRGHRRTYVGALPGRIIQALKKVGTKNPVLVLDEVDKMGVDMRGDPAAALLEALDPEQNNSFVDHYIDLPFDLSQVLFIATANESAGIPDALEDRLEVVEVPGYTRSDKLAIAEQFLVLKQLREHGLTEEQIAFDRDGLEAIIDHYTREAGVRGLEREIAAVCRSVAVRLAEGETIAGHHANREYVENVLGTQKYRPELAERKLSPGVATGLAAGAAGGELLFIEATQMPGKGKIRFTGSLRPVMKESAATAVSYVRSRADRLMLDPQWLKSIDLHMHVPRGGAARDAAGLGIPMFVAVASLLLGIPTRPDVAAAGEITLRGSVLGVGSVKDKVLAAHRAGILEIVLPQKNEADLDDVPSEIRDEMQIRLVKHADEVLKWMLERPPPNLNSRITRPSEPPTEMHP
ncbi:MAG TPA: endopeptidase La [Polyangiaceae bacterium]|jgi:ATP-dependent Lon protease|nr:endopeptidase La [Polyangiaceae bacterium]